MKKIPVCDKIVTLTDEEVKIMDAEIERRMREENRHCSPTRGEHGECFCVEVHTDAVYSANEKIAAMWKTRVAAQKRKRCKCYKDADYNHHTCQRCETLERWSEDWQPTVWNIMEGAY